MKKLLTIAIITLLSNTAKGQYPPATLSDSTHGIRLITNPPFIDPKWVSKTDTLKTEWAVIVDKNGFLKKISNAIVVSKYEEKEQTYWERQYDMSTGRRNIKQTLLDLKTEVLMLKHK